ncbi:MAG TPA: hypothetical protein VFD45_00595 [Patescibacteria group bacterium]|nr:hypothetical protein [Patescibacteria group bacterium]
MGCDCKCNGYHKHWDKDKEELTKADLLEKKEWFEKNLAWVKEELEKKS